MSRAPERALLEGITVRALTGEALEAALDDVARLRIAVFRDWPYLYDGSLDYEREYLSTSPKNAPTSSAPGESR